MRPNRDRKLSIWIAVTGGALCVSLGGCAAEQRTAREDTFTTTSALPPPGVWRADAELATEAFRSLPGATTPIPTAVATARSPGPIAETILTGTGAGIGTGRVPSTDLTTEWVPLSPEETPSVAEAFDNDSDDSAFTAPDTQIGVNALHASAVHEASAARSDSATTVRAVAAERAEGGTAASAPFAVSYEKRGIVVTLDDRLFATRQATLSASGDAQLAEVANFLAGYPGRSILVETHTDSAGMAPDNQRLSQRRAEIVRATLLARGVSSANLSARGYGETYPIASNASAPGRAKNGRVEIVLLRPGQTGPRDREMFEVSAGDWLATEPGEAAGDDPLALGQAAIN